MDDIFDNLIYIIITVVIFIISAIGKNKKKQAQKATGITEGTNNEKKDSPFSFSNIERLIKEEMGIEDQNKYNDPYENEVIEEKTGEEVLETVFKEKLDSKKDRAYSSIEYENTRDVFSSSIESSDLSNEESLEESILDDFNLQDAVIYSEIINRKEY